MEVSRLGDSDMRVLLAAAFVVLAPAALPTAAWAQPSAYDPLETFAPLTLPAPATALRGGAGTPGPAYWQNRVDYAIEAKIDTVAHVLTADETITYTNNSPDNLDFVWLQLDQNIYRSDSRVAAFGGATRRRGGGG